MIGRIRTRQSEAARSLASAGAFFATKVLIVAAVAVVALNVAPASVARAQHQTGITPMPEGLEMTLALSALPPPLRDDATVYVLHPSNGYRVAHQGSSGVECVVQRTAWEMGAYRDDVYIPLCHDAAGAATYLKVIMDAEKMRAEGMTAAALKTEIERRFRDGTYAAPAKPGLSYMMAPLMRTIGPPDLKIHTMAMPHLMFYAPGLSNADIGAKPDLAVPDSLRYPFVDRQGHDAQTYIIQLVGEADKAAILKAEHRLIEDLCAYRHILCMPQSGASHHAAPGS